MLTTSNEIGELLRELGIPDNWTEFHLHVVANDIVTAEVTYYPNLVLDKDGNLRTITKFYRLVEINEQSPGDDQ